jgi:hypothetical protein
MRFQQGYATISDPDAGGLQEFDTITCIHCGGVSMTRSSTGQLEVMVFRADGTHYMKEAGFCRSCMKDICPRCVGKPCDNRFKRLEREEAAARRFICR